MSTVTASHSLTLSKTGLKLIKAYEGFRAEDRELINGQRVVGYGHRLKNDRPRRVSKSQAERLLMTDLRPIEDMVNENVHAPMTQGQFDALVSFAFNIGTEAFLNSATLHAMNNGRPLDAANSLDVWRKSTINGQTYVVDALMRRRTAEKALFLRTDAKPKPAPTLDLPPSKDSFAAVDLEAPVFKEPEDAGLVAHVPIDKILDESEQNDISSSVNADESENTEIELTDILEENQHDIIDVNVTETDDSEGIAEDKVSARSSFINMGMTGFRNIDVSETVLVDVDDTEVDITDISSADVTPEEEEFDSKGVVTELFDTSSKSEPSEDNNKLEEIVEVNSDAPAFEDSILELIAPGNDALQQNQNDNPILVLNDRVEEENVANKTASMAGAAAATATATLAGGGSAIANAAADLSERLDALIEETQEEEEIFTSPEADALSERFAQSLAADDEAEASVSEMEPVAEIAGEVALDTVQETASDTVVIEPANVEDVVEPEQNGANNADIPVVEETKSAALNNPEVRLEGPLQDIDAEDVSQNVSETSEDTHLSVDEDMVEALAEEEIPVEETTDTFAANQNGTEEYVLTETVDEIEVVDEETPMMTETPYETSFTDASEAEYAPSMNERQADIIIDNLAEDDAMRSLSDTPIFIGQTETPKEVKEEGKGGLWIIIILGLLILTFAGILHFMGSSAQFGEWGASVVLSGLVVGSVTVLAGLYYTARRALKSNPTTQ